MTTLVPVPPKIRPDITTLPPLVIVSVMLLPTLESLLINKFRPLATENNWLLAIVNMVFATPDPRVRSTEADDMSMPTPPTPFSVRVEPLVMLTAALGLLI